MRNKTRSGFTLIEIMIVLVIIGITFGFALIAFGDFGASRQILFAAEQLVSTLSLAQQQAILENSTLGLRIDNAGYQILQVHNNSQWKPLSNKGIFKFNSFPSNTQITLKANHPGSSKIPAIIMTASGEMTPFTLIFGSNKEHNIAQLTGISNGELQLNVNNK